MTSQDMQTLTLLLENHFQKTQTQILQMRTDNAEFRAQMRADMDDFKKEIRTDFKELEKKVDAKIDTINGRIDKVEGRLDRVETQIISMQNEIVGLSHDVQNLYTWQYWLIAIILVVFVLPQFGENLKKTFAGIAGGFKFLWRVFTRK